jgi:thioredoxin-like negative regulator of GroEL
MWSRGNPQIIPGVDVGPGNGRDGEHASAALGSDNPDTLTTRSNLAHFRGQAGRVDEAVRELQALLEDRRRVLSPDHPATLRTRSNLATWLDRAQSI